MTAPRTTAALMLALAAITAGCRDRRSVEGLAVDLLLDRDTVSMHDSLSGTIRLRNTLDRTLTIEFPNANQTELLLYDETGRLAVEWPRVIIPVLSELTLGPLAAKDYRFSLIPWQERLTDSLIPGAYRARARPAEHDAPSTEQTVILTD